MRQNSITAAAPLGAGLSANQWIEEGVSIGIEGAVGYVVIGTGRCTDADFANNPLCGRHAHFNVFVFDTDAFTAQGLPTVNGDYETFAIALPERPERVPIFCTLAGLRFIEKGEVHIAAPCPSSE
ncbi:MAG: hypothetical protein ACI97K_002743 [Glaciecola sp.]|jgi:hypothetical protein